MYNKPFKRTAEILLSIVIGLLIAFLIKEFIIFNVNVPSESMETTVMTNDKLIGYRLAYLNKAPERGDIITFESPDNPGVTFLKRIIGLPGETLNIVDGKVYINNSDTPLDEPYINNREEPKGDFGPYVIPEGSYFVMGDNRNNSLDSRYWETTNFISIDDISSKIIFKYFPRLEKVE